MLDKHIEQLSKIIDTCLIHKQRLDYAYSKIGHLFPITEELYYTLKDDDMAYIDQYIFRFAKYQDLIGGKLFKQILLTEGEAVENMSFRDIFNRSEKIGIAEDWEQWFELRQMRNEISHEYPVISDEGVSSLNKIILSLDYLQNAYSKCIAYLDSRNYDGKS
jgi:uncharacterized protein with HEPN domain